MITWRGRSIEQYDTRGASVRLTPSGWAIFWTREDGRPMARGPFAGGLDAAMDCWAEIKRLRKTPCK
jgi:hypothetical protein